MAFNDTYRESIQSKHLANVGFTSTAKGVTNEGYALKNPHQVLPTQIPAIDVVEEYGPLVASGIAAGIVEKYTVKLTADPTVNNNKAWIAYADDDIEPTHSGAAHVRLDQWMRYAETQYKLRVYEDNGSNAPDYTSEILPSETAFNWEYNASAGIVYFDDDPATNGKTTPLWGVFYKYAGETLSDKIDTTTSGAGGNFIGLTDTPVSYTEGRVLFESDSAVVDDAEFTYDPSTNTLTVTDVNATGNVDVDGTLSFDSGTAVDEIVTTVDGGTDSQLPTAAAVDTFVTTVSGVLQDEIDDVANDLSTHNHSHNSLTGLQGGTTDQYYHLTSNEYSQFSAADSTHFNFGAGTALGVDGTFALSSGTSVNEIVTSMGAGSTDDQLPTAKSVYEAIEAKPNDFLGLTDTISVYTAGRLLVETDVALVDFAELTYVSGTQTFSVPNVDVSTDLTVGGDATIDGSLGFDTGTTINEFVTTVDASSTDDQVPTAGSVYDFVNTLSGSLQDDVVWEVVDTPTQQIRPKLAHQGKAIYTYGNLTIGGDLTVSGTTTTVHSEELTVADKIITVNAGEAGAGITGERYAGIEVDRGSESNYMFVFDEVQDNFRVGISGSLQAVATREDVPNDGYVAVWNASAVRFDTTIALADLATDAELSAVSGTLQDQITDNADWIAAHSDDDHDHNNLSGLQGGTTDEYYHLTNNEYGQFSAADANTFTFAPTTAFEVDGTFALATGTTVNEIVTAVASGTTDDQLPTAKAVFDAIEALGEAQDAFIELNDTPSSYTADRILFTTASGVVWSDDLTWDGSTLTVTGDITSTGLTTTSGLVLNTGATIDEFSTDTTLSGNSDTAVPTEAAVKGYVDDKFDEEVPVYYNVELTYDAGVWKYNGGLSSLPDNVQVFLNGVLNKDHSEYYTAVVNGGVLEVTFAFDTYSDDWVTVIYGDVLGTMNRTASWVTKTSAYNALNGDRIMVDSTGGAFTITLPSSPNMGDEVAFLDAAGYCGTANVTVDRNGSNIMGLAQDLDIDTDDASFSLVYYNASRGWVVK